VNDSARLPRALGPERERDDVRDISEARRLRDGYADAVCETVLSLEEMNLALADAAFQLAISGVWRDWEKEQPVGAVVQLDHAALYEAGDERVRALVRLAEQVADVTKFLRAGVAGKPRTP
jgi:hypothetical protein